MSPHDLTHALRENLANLRSLALVVDRTAEVVPAEVAGHISVAVAALEAALQHHSRQPERTDAPASAPSQN